MYDFITRKEFTALLEQATKPLQDRIAQLEKELDEWVDTKTAVRLTGRSEDTLLRDRKRPGTLIQFSKDGRKNLYLRSSLIDYTGGKTINYNPPQPPTE